MSNFEAWKLARNQKHPDDQVPDDLFMCTDPAILSVHLSRFVLETRKSNSEYYPPKTLYLILCGILRHMRSINPECVNFLDKKDVRFKSLHGVMDAHFHQLQLELDEMLNMREYLQLMMKKDCGRVVSWGRRPPKLFKMLHFSSLERCFAFVVVLNLENSNHHRLRGIQTLTYIYSEKMSKNRNGTFKQLNIANKVVPLFSCPEAGERCPVHILDMYFRKLPKESITKDIFFFSAT